jgi:ssDNA thymidine ADP-ribosyltransferase DarT-like protein
MDLEKIGVYRIIPIQNLEHILAKGIYCKNECPFTVDYVNIGSEEIIFQRDRMIVKCFPDTVVNDYVPFYFSRRTPMLYNIITGHGVPKLDQKDIIYLCCKLVDLATDDYQWCYSNGNAAKAITKFYTDWEGVESNLDWRSILTNDFRDDNADGDEDRVRKKHAEFLVKSFVPANLIKAIVVLNKEVEAIVKEIVSRSQIDIKVAINPGNKYYF